MSIMELHVCEVDRIHRAAFFWFQSGSQHFVCEQHLEKLQYDGVIPIAFLDKVESYEQYEQMRREEEKLKKKRLKRLKDWEEALESQYTEATDEIRFLFTRHPGFIPSGPILESLSLRKQKISSSLSAIREHLQSDSISDKESRLLQADYIGDAPFLLLVWSVDPNTVPSPVSISYQGEFGNPRDILHDRLKEITAQIQQLLQARSLTNLFRALYLLLLAKSLLPGPLSLHMSYYSFITHEFFIQYNHILAWLNQWAQQIGFAGAIELFICEDWRPIQALVALGEMQDEIAREYKQYPVEALLSLHTVLEALEGLNVEVLGMMKKGLSSRIGLCMRLGGRKTEAIKYLEESLRDIGEAKDDIEKKEIAMTYVRLGRCYKSSRNLAAASQWYTTALAILEAVAPQSKEIAKLLYYMAPLLTNPAEQIAYCDRSIQILSQCPEELAEIYGRKGQIYVKQRQYQEALKWYEKAHDIFTHFPYNYQDRTRLCQCLAEVLLKLQNPDGAIAVLAEASASLVSASDKEDEATGLFLSGKAWLMKGQLESAKNAFEGAKRAFESVKNARMAQMCENGLAKLAQL